MVASETGVLAALNPLDGSVGKYSPNRELCNALEWEWGLEAERAGQLGPTNLLGPLLK